MNGNNMHAYNYIFGPHYSPLTFNDFGIGVFVQLNGSLATNWKWPLELPASSTICGTFLTRTVSASILLLANATTVIFFLVILNIHSLSFFFYLSFLILIFLFLHLNPLQNEINIHNFPYFPVRET